MTLLIMIFAAIVSTLIWYMNERARRNNISLLCLTYWGASLMWLVDAAAEYLEQGPEFFTPVVSDMINDSFLGFSAVALGLVIWLVSVLLKDREHVFKK